MLLREVRKQIDLIQSNQGISYDENTTTVVVRDPDGQLREIDLLETGLSKTGERAIVITLR